MGLGTIIILAVLAALLGFYVLCRVVWATIGAGVWLYFHIRGDAYCRQWLEQRRAHQ